MADDAVVLAEHGGPLMVADAEAVLNQHRKNQERGRALLKAARLRTRDRRAEVARHMSPVYGTDEQGAALLLGAFERALREQIAAEGAAQ